MSADSATPLGKSAILVVDDVPSARKVLRRMLATIGFEDVSEAENGTQAFEYAAQKEFDIIITDLNLGEENGLELIDKLRDQGIISRFIVVTGETDDAVDNKAMQKSALALRKPFGKDQLRTKILQALSES
jgi:CheY-like chemotaxis protein